MLRRAVLPFVTAAPGDREDLFERAGGSFGVTFGRDRRFEGVGSLIALADRLSELAES